VGFDRLAWETLAAEANQETIRLAEQLDRLAPNNTTLTATTNWNSPDQVKVALKHVGIALDSTEDDALAAVNHPLAETLREYRSTAKLSSTYGTAWLKHVTPDGRVYATWKQIGAGASGRMSCKEPNLQNLPRDPRYRRCFIAPPGRVLVKADYSQIELRIAAKIANDQRMLDAYCKGEDLHTLTASAILIKPVSEVTKADRQLAKAVNFGLLYGQGAEGLMVYARSNYGVSLTIEEASAHRETFFRTYAGLRKWHKTLGGEARDTRTLTGRRRLDVRRFTERANTPVQGTGADGLKRALTLLWKRRATCPGAFPVLLVHDEIVVECAAEQADQAVSWVRDAMRDGIAPIISPVPIEVEATIGRTWGD
jgi:DNA polymerase-1